MKPEEVLKEEYVALRAEICQSIAKQHQITLAGYGLVSAASGYIIGASQWKAFIAIPTLFIAMAALCGQWNVTEWFVPVTTLVTSFGLKFAHWSVVPTLMDGRHGSDLVKAMREISGGGNICYSAWLSLLCQSFSASSQL